MKRLVYLDVIRGVAILLMVIDHVYDWWLTEAGQATSLARVTEFLGTMAAPLFLFLVGIGLAFSVQRSTAAGVQRQAILRNLLVRGGKLVLWGYGLNLLVFYTGDNLADIFAVDILQVIGVSIWLSILVLWWPGWAAAVGALIRVHYWPGGGWIVAVATVAGGLRQRTGRDRVFPAGTLAAVYLSGSGSRKRPGSQARAGSLPCLPVRCKPTRFYRLPGCRSGLGVPASAADFCPLFIDRGVRLFITRLLVDRTAWTARFSGQDSP